jgi:hypothetical protein
MSAMQHASYFSDNQCLAVAMPAGAAAVSGKPLTRIEVHGKVATCCTRCCSHAWLPSPWRLCHFYAA